MFGVYIVDDEQLALSDIINSIDWLEHGFQIIGTNTHPRNAFDDILTLKPDVVFCDLKMPVMDGVELISEIKKARFECEFIMLSAFGDFEASRNFFLLEGFDYLLKPLKSNDAALVLERISRKISDKKKLMPTTRFIPTQTKGFDDLICYITTNFHKKHTLKSLSQQFNISSTYICNLFSKHYQSTLTIFLTNIRMQEVAKRMIETDSALKEIAISCGYQNYFHFCKVFKAYYGMSPTEYRQKNKLNT